MFTSTPRVLRTLGTVLWAIALAGPVAATTISPVQPGATPLGVVPFSLVMAAGSDMRSAQAERDVLPILSGASLATLLERAADRDAVAIAGDPFRLVEGHMRGTRTHFLGGAARSRDGRSPTEATGGVPRTVAELLFPETTRPLGHGGSGAATLSLETPLLPSDFIDLHMTLLKGERLPLTLVADSASDGLLIIDDTPAAEPIALVSGLLWAAGL